MNLRKKLLRNFDLYAVTDLKTEDPDIFRKTQDALEGGVDVLQLRSKSLSDAVLLRIGEKLRVLTRQYERLMIVDDRPDLAEVLDADGVHLGQEDLPVQVARRIFRNPSRIVGKSTHSFDQALAAEREGADYIGFGPIYATPTKPDYVPLGLDPIREVHRRVGIPIVVIGGIDPTNVEQVLQAGARRIAVVRALWEAPDPFGAARQLKTLLRKYEMSFLQV